MRNFETGLMAGLIAGLLIGAIATFLVWGLTHDSYREQALKLGYAKMVVVNPATGETQWQWVPNEAKKEEDNNK